MDTTQASDEIRQSCHWCQIRAFDRQNKVPVSIVNETDDGAVLDPGFRFIQTSVFAKDVQLAEESFHSGCQCANDNDCMFGNCLCLQEMAPDSEEEPAAHGQRPGKKKRLAYYTRGARAGLLRRDKLNSRDPIYECHARCNCSARCPNRVVERGRTIPLRIFRTPNGRGWGVETPVKVRKGQFVDRYLGEVITGSEADRRRAAAKNAKRKDVYLFALDKFSNAESPDPRLQGPPLEVDGEFLSGPTRFINHSCDPNLRIFARVGDHADKHVHDLAFFAIKDIKAGEELTFDYVDGILDTPDSGQDASNEGRKKKMARCLCGSAKCRGYLW